MKEVTICFSFSVKDGLQKPLYESLATLSGLSIDGTKNIKSRQFAFRSVFLLLERISDLVDDFSISSIALRERKSANSPAVLKHKIPTSAKSKYPTAIKYKGE